MLSPIRTRLTRVKISRRQRHEMKQLVIQHVDDINGRAIDCPIEKQVRFRPRARLLATYCLGDKWRSAAGRLLRRGGTIKWEDLPQFDLYQDSGTGGLRYDEAVAAVIGELSTDTLGYKQEAGGRLYQRLEADPAKKGRIDGTSPDPLPAHLDNAFLPAWAQPECIHLYCGLNDSQVATEIIPMPVALAALVATGGPHIVPLLCHHAYQTAVSDSFVQSENEKCILTRPRPVLAGYDREGMPTRFLAKTYDIYVSNKIQFRDRYDEALSTYCDVLNSPALAIPVNLRPGQALSFNQVKNLHARGAVLPTFGRVLVRAYGRFCLASLLLSGAMCPKKPIVDAFRCIDR